MNVAWLVVLGDYDWLRTRLDEDADGLLPLLSFFFSLINIVPVVVVAVLVVVVVALVLILLVLLVVVVVVVPRAAAPVRGGVEGVEVEVREIVLAFLLLVGCGSGTALVVVVVVRGGCGVKFSSYVRRAGGLCS